MAEAEPQMYGPVDDPRRVFERYRKDISLHALIQPDVIVEFIDRYVEHKQMFDISLSMTKPERIHRRAEMICNEQFDMGVYYQAQPIGALATRFAEEFGAAVGLSQEIIDEQRWIAEH